MTDPFLKSAPKPQAGQGQATGPSQQGGGVTKKVKRGSKISMGGFLIGCIIFGLLIIGLVSLALYFVLSDPKMLTAIGIDDTTIKSLLMFFAILFFGLIFVFAFVMLVLNGYRLSTVKVGRFKYMIGTILGFIGLVFSFGFGYFSIMRISNLTGKTEIGSDYIVDFFLVSANNEKIFSSKLAANIAPSAFEIRLNSEKVRQQIGPSIGGAANFVSFEIDCGNGQKLSLPAQVLNKSVGVFPGYCLFLEKKEYPIVLTYYFIDEKSRDTIPADINLFNLKFDAGIDLSLTNGAWKLNDNKNEVLIGESPVTVKFNPSTIFTDLNIAIPNIKWDYEGDGQKIEESGSAEVRHEYTEDRLYWVNYSLSEPGYSDIIYTFPLRVKAPSGPQCDLLMSRVKKTNYRFNGRFQSAVNIVKYTFSVYDDETGKLMASKNTSENNFNYDFVRAGVYNVKLEFVTDEGETGKCSSDPIDTTSGKYRVKFKTYYSYQDEKSYKEYDLSGTDLIIETIPAYIKVQIEEIIPDLEFGTVELYFGDKEITTKNENTYEFEVDDGESKEVMFKIKDDKGRESTDKFNIVLKQRPLVPILKVSPQTGETPLTVVLDASISQKNDDEDEIINFDWDFGDGIVQKKVNDGKVKHTYRFDEENSNGTFYPKVTIYTLKNLKESTTSEYPIIVKRATPKAKINVDSHPTQRAKVGDTVRFSAEVDGVVKYTSWDFGNGKTNSCDGRECMNTSVTYDEAGTYRVKLLIEFQDVPSITEDITIEVK